MQEVNRIFIAAHELKAPLNLLRQLALNLDQSDSETDFETLRSEMISVSNRAIRQVNDLTKVARLEDGLFPMEPVVVQTVCDDVVAELKHLFASENRHLSVHYSNKSKLAIANRELLFSVVYNFLTNALHYSNRETISNLSVMNYKNHIRIKIRDFGPALPLNIWRDLKNDRLKSPTPIAMRPNSSGLGLYIASKFSRYMNAKIGAIRHRDGTSFFIELPISNQMSLF